MRKVPSVEPTIVTKPPAIPHERPRGALLRRIALRLALIPLLAVIGLAANGYISVPTLTITRASFTASGMNTATTRTLHVSTIIPALHDALAAELDAGPPPRRATPNPFLPSGDGKLTNLNYTAYVVAFTYANGRQEHQTFYVQDYFTQPYLSAATIALLNRALTAPDLPLIGYASKADG